jgi:hypothetical protein
MIRVKYAPVPDLIGVQAVSVATGDGTGLKIGYIRNDFLGTWVARSRPGTLSRDEPVRVFRTRTDAAAWLLVVGGFAQPSERRGVAA